MGLKHGRMKRVDKEENQARGGKCAGERIIRDNDGAKARASLQPRSANRGRDEV